MLLLLSSAQALGSIRLLAVVFYAGNYIQPKRIEMKKIEDRNKKKPPKWRKQSPRIIWMSFNFDILNDIKSVAESCMLKKII